MEYFIISLGICSAVMSVISFFCIGLSHLLKKTWSAKHRFYLWLFILIGFITPFKPSFGTPIYEISINAPAASIVQEADYFASSQAATDSRVPDCIATHINIAAILFAVWISGVAFLSVRYTYKHYQFKKYTKRVGKPCDKAAYDTATKTASQIGIRKFKIIILPGITSPMMIGFRYPTIILPESIYSKAEFRLIIKHELSHFLRHDLVSKCFILACRTVHWFNPLMRYIVSHIDQVCELACDEIVMFGETAANRKLYCHSILTAVMAQNASRKSLRPVIASDFGNSKHNLKHRLEMIISSRSKKKLGMVCVIIALVTLFSGTVIAISDVSSKTNISVIGVSDDLNVSKDESPATSASTTTTIQTIGISTTTTATWPVITPYDAATTAGTVYVP